MSEPRSKRVVVKTDKAASSRVGTPVAVVKTANRKFGRKHARSSAAAVLSEALREGQQVPSAGPARKASKTSSKAAKKAVTSSKKVSKASRAAAKAPSGRFTTAELEQLADERQQVLVKKTSDTYASHTRKWQVQRSDSSC